VKYLGVKIKEICKKSENLNILKKGKFQIFEKTENLKF